VAGPYYVFQSGTTFLFQAEDGIRDFHVTGVQTCALPILEALTLERDTLHFKAQLSQKYAELVYYGQWFSPLREALDAFVDKTQEIGRASCRERGKISMVAV